MRAQATPTKAILHFIALAFSPSLERTARELDAADKASRWRARDSCRELRLISSSQSIPVMDVIGQ